MPLQVIEKEEGENVSKRITIEAESRRGKDEPNGRGRASPRGRQENANANANANGRASDLTPSSADSRASAKRREDKSDHQLGQSPSASARRSKRGKQLLTLGDCFLAGLGRAGAE
jgi:hypothetical protein